MKKSSVPTEKSIKFFINKLAAFLARLKPLSTIAKPACIKNTRKAVTNNQITSIWLSEVTPPSSCAYATLPKTNMRIKAVGKARKNNFCFTIFLL